MTALELRQKIRSNQFQGTTSGLAKGYLQANLVILPEDWAEDFLLFCQRNPVACPLIAVGEAGNPYIKALGDDINIKTDVPQYHLFQDGEYQAEVADLQQHWRDDLVTFVLGCSFSFEEALIESGLSVRNIEQNKNVSMFNTHLPCQSAGRFQGHYVVSMRPFLAKDAIEAIQITSRFPKAHGAPIHMGDPSLIGIADLNCPDYGDRVDMKPHEIPLFWACGVTPQNAIRRSKPPFCITHAPGKMLITDRLNREFALRE
ncbi:MULTISPECIES: putative hydro-lyase [unclassified Vibrio]|uniref:Putative hydro-lyase AB0763_15495 n=1 Tax=Vibrio sp. HB236076 TaxID=3232307 RepID=A0AB39HEG4_9VIBR|nr:putative hydro-lyase [Vibrio sp. HB161653]MDP5252730.1 putative hydro-lyase [Vibrio sp. HB161653]